MLLIHPASSPLPDLFLNTDHLSYKNFSYLLLWSFPTVPVSPIHCYRSLDSRDKLLPLLLFSFFFSSLSILLSMITLPICFSAFLFLTWQPLCSSADYSSLSWTWLFEAKPTMAPIIPVMYHTVYSLASSPSFSFLFHILLFSFQSKI